MKMEFSKKLLIVDYIVMAILVVLDVVFKELDLSVITVAWIAQVGVSSAAYYWKAKCDNRTKVPLKVIESLPEDIRNSIDLTQVITAIIEAE